MGLLDGDLRDGIFAAFQGRLLSGEVRRKSGATSGGTDAHGDPLDIDTAQWLIEGYIDTYSRTLRAAAGIPDSSVKVCIFAGSALDYSPHADDLVRLGERWVRLEAGPFDIDPAGALWTAQAVIVEAPQ